MQLQGSLSELKLPDILQLANMSQETGVVEFKNSEGVTGKIVLENGEVIHARVDELVGDEAVYEIAIWFEGSFRVVPVDKAYSANVEGNLTSLLMESARRLDEWRVLARKIPSLSYFPFIVEDSPREQTLNTTEWEILRYVDGSRNLRDIAVTCGRSPFAVSKLVYGLLIHNMVALSKTPKKVTQEVELPPLVEKLIKLKESAMEICGGLTTRGMEEAVEKGLAQLEQDPGDKKAVIDAANAMLQEWMDVKGKDETRILAARFKNILKGQADS